MSDQNRNNDSVLGKVDAKRRDFLKTVLAAGFAAPVVATFSIDALAAESANAGGAPNSSYPGFPNVTGFPNVSNISPIAPNTCATDLGYVGPSSFQAHLVAVGPTEASAAGMNGEATLSVTTAPSINVQIIGLTGGSSVSISNVALVVNGESISISLNKTNAGTILPGTDLGKICNLDEVLNALATGRATITVEGKYSSESFTLSGVVQPVPPATVTLNP